MKKYKSLVVSSLIAAVILSVPFAGFAESNNNKNENRVRLEEKNMLKSNNGYSNSFWNRVSSMFRNGNNINPTNLSPIINGVTAPTVLNVGEMGTWIVKASDLNNGTLSYSVDWGDENKIFSKSMIGLSQPLFVQDATFTHSYSKIGNYNVTFTVSNEIGQKATSKISVHVVGQAKNTPVISNLLVNSIKSNKATVNWTTNVKSDTVVWVSKESPVNTLRLPDASRKAYVSKHKIELKKLEAGTKYYIVVASTNNIGTTKSSEISFMTPTLNGNYNPVITSLKGPNAVNVGETINVIVNAYDPKNGTLAYTADWGDVNTILNSKAATTENKVYVQSATFSHVYTIAGTYTATFTVENSEGKKDSSSMKVVVGPTSTDTTNPIISNIKTLTGSTTSTISWTTDEPSTSEVFYSLNTPVDVNAITTPSVSSKYLVKNHSLSISGLTSGTIYHFVIKSADAKSDTTISSESAFITNLGL
jgi:hypothetical protein